MKERPMMIRTTVTVAVLCAAICVPASANQLPWEKGQRGPQASHEKMAKRIKAKRAELIRSRIGLDEEQAGQVLATLERFDPRRRELMQKKRSLGQAMDRLFKSDSAEDAEYRKVLAGLQSMEDAMHRLRSDQAAALGDVVTPRFQLRILVALKRFQRRLHKRQRERRGAGEGKRRGPRDEKRPGDGREKRGAW
jgi:hypothetical protein